MMPDELVRRSCQGSDMVSVEDERRNGVRVQNAQLTSISKGLLAVTLCLGLLTACSDGSGHVTAPSAGPAVSAVSSAAAEPTADPTESPAATTEPSPVATPAATSAALTGPYRKDPGVKFLVTYFKASAAAINARNANLPALVALETADQRPYTVKALKEEYGRVAPDVPPFVPLSVGAPKATVRTVNICVLADGWTLDAKTKKPAKRRKVQAQQAELVKSGGTWKVEAFYFDSFSCSGVSFA